MKTKPRYYCADTAESGAGYENYLQTDHWRDLRRIMIAAVGGICQECKNNRPLQIHHKHYRTIGREALTDLRAICAACHAKEHDGERFCSNPDYVHASLGHMSKGALVPLCMWERKDNPRKFRHITFAYSPDKITCPLCKRRYRKHIIKAGGVICARKLRVCGTRHNKRYTPLKEKERARRMNQRAAEFASQQAHAFERRRYAQTHLGEK